MWWTMNKYEGLSKEQLIFLLQRYQHSMLMIGEICVSSSKQEISAESALNEIKDNIVSIPYMSNKEKLSAWVDYMRGKISSKEYRKIILGEEDE